MHHTLEFIAPFLAVVVGGLIVYFFRSLSFIRVLLVFSGAFLLSIVVFEMIPDIYMHNPPQSIGLWVMSGILLQVILEYFSKGAEHGHMHKHTQKSFPWILFVSLSAHALLEGMPLHHHHHLIWGIVIHKLPVAMLLTFYFFKAKFRSSYIVLFLFGFGIMTPIGTWVAQKSDEVAQYSIQMSAVVVGMFLHIATTILFESSEGHRFKISKIIAFVLAVMLAWFL